MERMADYNRVKHIEKEMQSHLFFYFDKNYTFFNKNIISMLLYEDYLVDLHTI